MTNNGFFESVIAVITAMAHGDVMAYGDVAAEAGYPGAARAVGNILRQTPGLPWWRVVTASGRLVPGHEPEQAQLLRSEGVSVTDGKVVLRSAPHPTGTSRRDT
jgi:methylated-DNA-protein-cysteine methyltransferase-like protein